MPRKKLRLQVWSFSKTTSIAARPNHSANHSTHHSYRHGFDSVLHGERRPLIHNQLPAHAITSPSNIPAPIHDTAAAAQACITERQRAEIQAKRPADVRAQEEDKEFLRHARPQERDPIPLVRRHAVRTICPFVPSPRSSRGITLATSRIDIHTDTAQATSAPPKSAARPHPPNTKFTCT